MADIFLSYAREDADSTEKLAAALESSGYTVWWDRHLDAGARYLNETESALKSAKAVVVVWTAASIQSHWVADEAGVSRELGTLIPITLDGSMPPLGFRQFQVLDFSRWSGGSDDKSFRRLCAALAKLAPLAAEAGEAAPAEAGVTRPAGRPPRQRWVPAALTALAVATAALGAGSIWLLKRNADAAWVEETFVPEMETHLSNGRIEEAYALAKRARARAPDSRTVEEFWPRLSWQATITSDPAGAKVFRRAYDAPADAEWEELGVTPLEGIRIPYNYSRLRFELDGYLPLVRAVGGGNRSVKELPPDFQQLHPFMVGSGGFKLEPADGPNRDKVRVPGWRLGTEAGAPAFNDFFLDRTEVTNARYKEFIDAGGYRKTEFWDPIVDKGKVIPWADAMALFVDSSGQPGPATWIGGDYLKGRDDFPVTGVSWYEASAYARFRGQQLPTVHHWDGAVAPAEAPWLIAASNFSSDQPRKVGEGDAMSYVGAVDMFGNAREWTASAIGGQRILRGGGWTDPQNCFDCLAPPLDRSATNGFRLAVIKDDPKVEAFANAAITPPPSRPWPEPVNDELFAAYSGQFSYEQAPLDAVIEQTTDARSWKRERISFDAPDTSDRMILYLFLPKAGSPPYQVVINWPDATGATMTNAEGYANELDFLLKGGRAVALPVLWDNFQRGDGSGLPKPGPAERDRLVHMVKDTRRAVDYLESRSEIDAKAIGLYAFSWGASLASVVLAQEPRIRVGVLNTGGIPFWPLLPEVDPLNAAPRIKIPMLLLKGRYDSIVSLASSEHLFQLLGSQQAKKKYVVVDGGHHVPRDVVVRETLEWLDKHLGAPRS